jgi:hypothetical protein
MLFTFVIMSHNYTITNSSKKVPCIFFFLLYAFINNIYAKCRLQVSDALCATMSHKIAIMQIFDKIYKIQYVATIFFKIYVKVLTYNF